MKNDCFFQLFQNYCVFQWDLVCENEVVKATSTAIYMTGAMLSTIISGNLSDVSVSFSIYHTSTLNDLLFIK